MEKGEISTDNYTLKLYHQKDQISSFPPIIKDILYNSIAGPKVGLPNARYPLHVFCAMPDYETAIRVLSLRAGRVNPKVGQRLFYSLTVTRVFGLLYWRPCAQTQDDHGRSGTSIQPDARSGDTPHKKGLFLNFLLTI